MLRTPAPLIGALGRRELGIATLKLSRVDGAGVAPLAVPTALSLDKSRKESTDQSGRSKSMVCSKTHDQQRPTVLRIALVGSEATRRRKPCGIETKTKPQWRNPELNVARVQGLR